MNNQNSSSLKSLACIIALIAFAQFFPFQAGATIVGPYVTDTNTLFLFHLSEPPGSEPGGYNVATNLGTLGGVAITCTNGQGTAQLTNPPAVTDMLGAAAYPGFGYCLTNTSTSAGLGLAGFDFNKNGKFNSGGQSNFLLSAADYLAMTNFNMGAGTNSPFTFEAMICPLNNNAGEILCSDSFLSKRGFQFRLAGGGINFNPIASGSNITATIPTTGNNAFVANTWFHVAVVYDGTNDYVYWTLVNPTNTAANLVTNFAVANFPMTVLNFGTNVLGPLVIGNTDRGDSGAFAGRIGEIRISKVARAANQMLFANGLVLAANPANASTAVGGTVTFSVAASSDYSLNYFWRTNGVLITNGTGAAGAVFSGANTPVLQIANVQLADAGFTYDCAITNSRPTPGPDSTNSTTASLSVSVPHYLSWLGAVDSTWATTAGADWHDNIAMGNVGFTTLDNVAFDDNGSGNPVNIPGTVQPVITTVSSSGINYTFTGNGKITGTTGLTKTNGSTLTIQTTNDYTGVNNFNGGIVSVSQLANGGSPSAIGAASGNPGNLIIDGGELQYTGPNSSIDRGATLGAADGTVEVTVGGNTLTLGGIMAGPGGLVKTGSGTLLLGGTNTYSGTTTVNAGRLGLSGNTNGMGSFGAGNIVNNSALTFSGGSSNTTFVILNNISGTGILTNDSSGGNEYFTGTNSFSGNIYFNGPGSLMFANSNALGNATNVTLLGTSVAPFTFLTVTNNESMPPTVSLVAKVSNNTRASVYASLVNNGGGIWNGPVTLISSDNNGGTFQFGAGSTLSSSPLVFNGNITGINLAANTSVQLRNAGLGSTRFGTVNGQLNLGPAQVIVNDGAFWTIGSTGNAWGSLQIANGRITLAQNNALCTTAPLLIGSGGTGAVFDMAGFSQQIGGLTNSGTTGLMSITNSSTIPVTLTYSNSNLTTFNNFSGFGATIRDVGTGVISLNVAGGSLLLQNTVSNAYHGVTTINGAGILALAGTAQITNSAGIAISGSAAKFDASGVTGGFALFKAQTLSGIGVVTGAVTVAAGAILSPGNGSIGILSFSNGLTLNAASTNAFAVTTTGGASNAVIVAGLLTPNSSVVKVASGTALAPGSYALFNYNTISGAFNPVPSMDIPPIHPPAAIVNNGAGQINLVVSNRPPTAQTVTVTRPAGLGFHVGLTDISTNWADADGDTVTWLTVNPTSTNGILVQAVNGQIFYPNSPNVNDQISYTITDGYSGGTSTGLINIAITNSAAGNTSIAGITTGTSNAVTAYGIPGYSYILERTTNLPPVVWIDIDTNAAANNGLINLNDTFWDLGGAAPGAAYYRLKWNP